MLSHRLKSSLSVLIVAFATTACTGMLLSPTHLGKYTFKGTVTDQSGKPVPNAWVKVRGWETLTNAEGRWEQVQVVNCGALREHPTSFTENDAILVTAKGYKPAEENFVVKHPSYFESCEPEQTVAFDVKLRAEGIEEYQNREATKFKVPEHEAVPLPEHKRLPSLRKSKGTEI